MEDDADIGNASGNLNLINIPKEKYIFCSNISGWVLNMDENLSRSSIAACGIISYKLTGECHLPPRSFPFVELSHDENVLRKVKAVEQSRINNNEKKEKSDTEEKKEITGPSVIDKLYLDCLIEIFSKLPLEQRLVIEDVCLHWRDVSKKSWRNIRELHVCSFIPYSFIEHFTHSEFVEKLLMKCGVYLRTLKLNFVCSSHMLKVIGDYCHNLTTIDLTFTQSDVEHFEALSKLKKLQSFTTTGTFSPECMINCLQNLPKTIKSIHIGYTSINNWRKLSIAKVLEEFTELKSLTLYNFYTGKDLMKVISRKITIIELSMGFMTLKEDLKLLANMSNLEHLDLSGLYHVDDHFLRCISIKCKKLKYLDVSYCYDISDDGIGKLRNLNNLEVLLINQTDISDLPLGQLRGIKKLQCEDCPGVEDPGIIQLIENCPDLEELNVVDTHIKKRTLQLAIRVTKDRKNGIILSLTADLEKLEFNYQSEDYSPFLKINGPSEKNRDHLKCEHDDYEYEKYEKYHPLPKREY